jgi:hypothetical protein
MIVFFRRHASEFVSLTLMMLMVIALITGQAGARLSGTPGAQMKQQQPAITATLDAALESVRFRADLVIDFELFEAAGTESTAEGQERRGDIVTLTLLDRS